MKKYSKKSTKLRKTKSVTWLARTLHLRTHIIPAKENKLIFISNIVRTKNRIGFLRTKGAIIISNIGTFSLQSSSQATYDTNVQVSKVIHTANTLFLEWAMVARGQSLTSANNPLIDTRLGQQTIILLRMPLDFADLLVIVWTMRAVRVGRTL